MESRTTNKLCLFELFCPFSPLFLPFGSLCIALETAGCQGLLYTNTLEYIMMMMMTMMVTNE